MPSSDRVATRMSPNASSATKPSATRAMISQSTLPAPSPSRNDWPNSPTSAADAMVNSVYVAISAKPAKKPARGPSVAPASANTLPAELKWRVRRMKP
jgi:hypothetical protein